jgi:hypothetical protein
MERGYFSIGADWDESSDREVYAGSMSIELIAYLATFEGILTYELKRRHVKPDDRHDLLYIRLFVVWKSEGYKKFRIFIHLIEYDKYVDWDEVKLKEYYKRYSNQLCTYTGSIKDTWLMNDGTVLMTGLDLDFAQRDGILNITISKGVKDEHTKRPEWINLEK